MISIFLNRFASRLLLSLGVVSTMFLSPANGQGTGNDNPTGVVGGFSGTITSGGSYDAYTASASRTITDLQVPGAVSSNGLAWTRTMNTRGDIWRSAYSFRMIGTNVQVFGETQASLNTWYEPLSIKTEMADGRSIVFSRPNPNNEFFEGPAGIREHLRQNPGNAAADARHFYIWLPDGTSVHFIRTQTVTEAHFDPEYQQWTGYQRTSYQLTDISDPFSRQTVFSYDAAGRLYRITDPSSRYLQCAWVTSGANVFLDKVTSWDGQWVEYEYGQKNGLWVMIKATYSDDTPSIATDNPAATYTYQGSNLNATTGVLPLRCNDVRFSGPMRRIKYDYAVPASVPNAVFGQIVAEKFPYNSDAANDVVVSSYVLSTHTETRGDSTSAIPVSRQFTYSGYKLTAEKDFEGNATTYGYDANGFRSTIVNSLNQTTTLTREPKVGNITKITYPGGAFKSITYTDANYPYWVKSTTDELGRVTTYTRDPSHRVTKIAYPATAAGTAYETFTYNGFGQVLEHRMTNGRTELNTYNNLGQLTFHTDPYSKTSPFTYDSNGRIKTVTDPFQNVTTYSHDQSGQLTAVYNPDGTSTTYTYDVYGNKLTERNAMGHVTSYAYDQYNRVVSVTDPANKTTISDYLKNKGTPYNHTTSNPTWVTSPEGRKVWTGYNRNFATLAVTNGATGPSDASSSSYTYNAIGQVSTVTNDMGKVWTTTYDNRGRKATSKDPLNQTTTWTYDQVGNVKTVKLANNTVTTTNYDARNRPLDVTDDLGGTINMGYDLAGNLESLKDKQGKTYSYNYDWLNRQTRQTYPDTSFEETTYDKIGRLQTYRNRAGNLQTYSYDFPGRSMQTAWDANGDFFVSYRDGAGRISDVGSNAGSLHYQYDAVGRTLREEQEVYGLPPKFVSYTYDGDGNRLSATYPDGTYLTYVWNRRSENTGILQNGTYIVAYVRDTLGRPTSKNVYPGAQTDYQYNPVGNVNSITHSAGLALIGSFNYGYNNVNNRSFVKREDGLGDAYGYDRLQQLTTVKYDASSVDTAPASPVAVGSYTYNAAGNRLTSGITGMTPWNYTPNPNNTYASITGITPASTPVYDNNRNLASWKGWTYTHDADNKLADAVSSTTNAHFYRDPSSRISRTVINGVTTYNIYDGWDIILRYDANGAMIDRMVYGTATDEIISRTTASGVGYYYLFDGLGSVSHVIGNGNVVLERYSYDAYGKATFETAAGAVLPGSAIGNRYLFTGREYLAEIGLYDYRNRTYSAEQGRFLEPDPTGFGAGDDNMYRYCENDPVNGKDPTGLIDEHKPGDVLDTPTGSHIPTRISNSGYIVSSGIGTNWTASYSYRIMPDVKQFSGLFEKLGYETATSKGSSQYEILYTVPSGQLLINFMVEKIKAGLIHLFFLNTDESPSETYPSDATHVTMFMRPNAPATVIAHEIQHSVRMLTGDSNFLLPVSDITDGMEYMLENEAVRAQNIAGYELSIKNGSIYRPLMKYNKQPILQNPYGRYSFSGK